MAISLRNATKEDIDLIYEWANDPITRAASFSTASIPYEDHVKWFSNVLVRDDCTLYVAMNDKLPVGQMRIDVAGDRAELSYSIAPLYRSQGFGKELISYTLNFIISNKDKYGDISTVIARVKPDNFGSSRMLISNGFIKRSVTDTYIEYMWNINKQIYIRTDMNSVIATGHLMRCLSIADAAKRQGVKVVFISADNNPVELIESRGYKCIVLGTDWQNMETELDILHNLIDSEKIDNLLVDSYQVTEKYLAELTRYTRTIYIDDVNAFLYPVDDLIVYADYYKKWNLSEIYEDKTRLILGTDYVPLRGEFEEIEKATPQGRIKNILIMSGGSDSYDIIPQMLNAIMEKAVETDGYTVTAICGRYYEKYDELCELYKNNLNISILKAVPNLIDYIKKADFCITAGGTTLYEICACGTCAATYSFADNQIHNVEQFEAEGLMPYLGDARYPDAYGHSIYENAVSCIMKYEEDEIRRTISERMQSKIDGHGAGRIVDRLFEMQTIL